MDAWASIKFGREALGDYLTRLSPEQWTKPSPCAGWTVQDVAAHMLVIPTKSKGQVFRAFAGSGFNLEKMNAKFVTAITASKSTTEIAALTRSSAGSQSRPPGLALPGVLTELAVHSSDIAEGAGVPFTLPVDVYVAALEHLKNTKPVFKAQQRIEGLTIRATDTDWSTGSGPVVEGPAQLLAMAVAGRPAILDRLSGDGVATMRSR